MQISKLKTLDFQGLAGTREWEFGHVNVLCGPNGTGKTSLLNAIQYGLSGKEPSGTLVHAGAPKAAVGIEFADGTNLIRQKTAGGSTTAFRSMKKTTVAQLNEAAEESIGAPMPAVRAASASDVMYMMKPQEFMALILSYTKDSTDLPFVTDSIPGITDLMKEELAARLPAGEFGLAEIDGCWKSVIDTRRALKKEIQNDEGAVMAFRNVALPPESKEELADAEKRLIAAASDEAAYRAARQAWERAVRWRESVLKEIRETATKADAIKAEAKDPALRVSMTEGIASKTDQIVKAESQGAAMAKSADDIGKILTSIGTSVCPLSDKIVCKTDKTAIREELEQSLAGLNENIGTNRALVLSLKEELAAMNKALSDYDRERNEWEKKEFYLNVIARKNVQLDSIRVPEEPKAPAVTNAAAALQAIRKKLEAYSMHERAGAIEAGLSGKRSRLEACEALAKALDPKGCVRQRITERYMHAFEDLCNTKAAAVKPGMEFRFVAGDGVHVFVSVRDGVFVPWRSLSGGERAVAVYILMDMMNALSGLKILILDELSVLDDDMFRSLLSVILEHKDEYDHIFLASARRAGFTETLDASGTAYTAIDPGTGR